MSKRSVQPDGEKISQLRKIKNLTQWELAKRAGIDPRTVWNIENGARALPKNIEAIAGVLDVNYAALLASEKPSAPPSH